MALGPVTDDLAPQISNHPKELIQVLYPIKRLNPNHFHQMHIKQVPITHRLGVNQQSLGIHVKTAPKTAINETTIQLIQHESHQYI